MPRSLRSLPLVVAALTASLATLGAASARADSAATSSNWAGYAASKNGISFRRVAGTWVQPTVSCTAGQQGFSANWVGLGGYHQTSKALEQIGTEADCTASGKAVYSAWYELVPDTSKAVKITVKAGDTLSASVAVRGHTVQLRLANRTRGTLFEKTLSAATVDTTSADWIVEAPAVCFGAGGLCRPTPLANFGTTGFNAATATTSAGHTGPIVDPAWSRAAITLSPQGGRRFAGAAPAAASGSAAPSPLSATGNGFLVVFQGVDGSAQPPATTG
jgi:Peptidase A4 family